MLRHPSHSGEFHLGSQGDTRTLFSAALCRGLIEASKGPKHLDSDFNGFPRLYAAASLKPAIRRCCICTHDTVFRGFMPRPH